MCGKMQASGLTGFNASTGTSAIWGNPGSLFTLRSGRQLLLAFPSSSAITMGGGSIPWISFGSPHSQLETRNHWWLWHFLFIDVAGDIFISQTRGKNPILNIPVCSSLRCHITCFNLFLGTRLGCGFQSGNLLVGENGYSFPYPA